MNYNKDRYILDSLQLDQLYKQNNEIFWNIWKDIQQIKTIIEIDYNGYEHKYIKVGDDIIKNFVIESEGFIVRKGVKVNSPVKIYNDLSDSLGFSYLNGKSGINYEKEKCHTLITEITNCIILKSDDSDKIEILQCDTNIVLSCNGETFL